MDFSDLTNSPECAREYQFDQGLEVIERKNHDRICNRILKSLARLFNLSDAEVGLSLEPPQQIRLEMTSNFTRSASEDLCLFDLT